MELLTILIIFGSLLVGYGIGANSGANCLGSAVGANVINYKKAAYFISILALIGAALQGHHTASTIGTGIIDLSIVSHLAILAILLSAGIMIIAFSYFGLPVSTTMSIIGSIIGVGLLLKMHIGWKMSLIIFFIGFICPLVSAFFSFIFYKVYSKLIAKRHFLLFEKSLKFFLLISGGFLAYSLGANDIGNALGPVLGKGLITPVLGGLIAGLALAFGTVTLGGKVMKTVAVGITRLNSAMAFASQLGAALAIYILTLLSIPTSTTFAIIGGIAGVGIVKGISTIDFKTVKQIVIGWIITPVLSALFAIILFKLFSII
ncbi:MAG: inorganic phosphate transporter [Nanoarchaeota archaeon]|nr:inorganic phosphate transporter [Nanoarchaeota archaeon]